MKARYGVMRMTNLEGPFLIGFKVERDVPKAENVSPSTGLFGHEKRVPSSLLN